MYVDNMTKIHMMKVQKRATKLQAYSFTEYL